MDRNRLVSVIMPTYNAGKYLADSVSSILDQTYLDLELLITDDGSTDPVTLEILHKIEERDSRVDVIYLDHNHGAGYARNKSIERAREDTSLSVIVTTGGHRINWKNKSHS